MAQKTVRIDDIDGGEDAETVTFALDGVNYEIDLSQKNAAALRDAFASWVGNARRVSGRSSRAGTRRGGTSSPADSSDVRTWAKQNGYQVSERGRISAEVADAYAAAH